MSEAQSYVSFINTIILVDVILKEVVKRGIIHFTAHQEAYTVIFPGPDQGLVLSTSL